MIIPAWIMGNLKLLAAARLVEQNPHYKQLSYYSLDKSVDCGTPACVLGTYAFMHPKDWDWPEAEPERRDYNLFASLHGDEYWLGAGREFCLTQDEATLLFDSDGCGIRSRIVQLQMRTGKVRSEVEDQVDAFFKDRQATSRFIRQFVIDRCGIAVDLYSYWDLDSDLITDDARQVLIDSGIALDLVSDPPPVVYSSYSDDPIAETADE